MPHSLDTLKKAFLIGVGASVVTADKISDFMHGVVDDLVVRGHLTAVDARKLADDLSKRAGKETTSLQKSVETAVKNAIKSLGLVTQDDLRQLRRELSAVTPKKPAAKTKAVPPAKKPVARKTAKKRQPA